MKILYVSCHSVLQVDELKLLRSLGHEVDLIEPGKLNCPDKNYDVILNVHRMDWFQNIKTDMGAKIIYRSIGQSTPHVEQQLSRLRKENGWKIIRYSPAEERIINYAGSDGLVRFSKDSNIYKDWNGSNKKCVMFANHIHDRPIHCKLKYMEVISQAFDSVLHGWGNEPIESISTEKLEFDEIPSRMRDARVIFYTGTFPASYTLNFMEAMMTGVPIVAIGHDLFMQGFPSWGDVSEVPDIIMNGVNGYCSSNIQNLLNVIHMFLNDYDKAKEISHHARQTALTLFREEVVKEQWENVLYGM